LEVFDWELVIGQRKKENRKEGKELMTNITKVEF